jgi:hypothetical protein
MGSHEGTPLEESRWERGKASKSSDFEAFFMIIINYIRKQNY